MAQVDHEEPPPPDGRGPPTLYVLKVDPRTVPQGTPHADEVALTMAELLPKPSPWAKDGAWASLSTTVRGNRIPPLCPAVMQKAWQPKAHLQAPDFDDSEDEALEEGWAVVRQYDPEVVDKAVAEIEIVDKIVREAARREAAA